MARIPYPNPEDLPEEVRAAAEKLPPLNIMKMFLNAPTKLAGIAAKNVAPTPAPNIDTVRVIGRRLIHTGKTHHPWRARPAPPAAGPRPWRARPLLQNHQEGRRMRHLYSTSVITKF